jgi:DNA-binding NarL/FixJ family response regulator
MIPVLIVEDHPLVAEGLKSILSCSDEFNLHGHANSGAGFLNLYKSFETGVVLMDIRLPDTNGIELCKIIKASNKPVQVIALTTFNQQFLIKEMLDAGALSYLLKNATPDEIREAIRKAWRKQPTFSKPVKEQISQLNNRSIVLSKREVEVLCLIAEGLTNNQIAEKLFISHLTVDSHRKNLLLKTGSKNSAALIKFAVDQGYVES